MFCKSISKKVDYRISHNIKYAENFSCAFGWFFYNMALIWMLTLKVERRKKKDN